jgi:hypothetical protein
MFSSTSLSIPGSVLFQLAAPVLVVVIFRVPKRPAVLGNLLFGVIVGRHPISASLTDGPQLPIHSMMLPLSALHSGGSILPA